MSKIFISYRRDDSADVCGRITDHLMERFGKNAVFKDVDSLHGGDQFPARLSDALRQCDVALVVIGQRWLSISDVSGRRRLDDPGDFVRYEVEEMLRRGIAVLPVLVQGAGMPDPRLLPPSLAALAAYPPLVVRPEPDFRQDMQRLAYTIRVQVRAAEKKRQRPLPHPLLTLAALLGLTTVGVVLAFNPPSGTPASAIFGPLFVLTYAFALVAAPYQAVRYKRWAWLALLAVVIAISFGLWTAFPSAKQTGDVGDAAVLILVLAFSLLSARFSLLPGSLSDRAIA